MIPTTTTGKSTPTGRKTTTVKHDQLTPLGTKKFTVGKHSYTGKSSFSQGGKTYYGVSNPAEYKSLHDQGVDTVKNPNDPTGKGNFVVAPGSSPTIVPTKTDTPSVTKTTSATVKPASSSSRAKSYSNANQRRAANRRAANERRAANRVDANQRKIANRKG
jgi:hypothetical protein